MNRMKYCFLQVSDRLLNPDDKNNPADVYFKAIWPNMAGKGYYKPEHYWEIPTWIAELSYCFDSRDHELMLYHLQEFCGTNCPHMSEHYPRLPDADFYFASVMDCNKEIIQTIVKRNPNKSFYLGGYIGLEELYKLFAGCENVVWCDSIKECCHFLDLNYRYGTDYSLFKGMKCIPRLTLSNGCTNHCRFCTVPDEIVRTNPLRITQQIESMKDLDFELVYINDKTFGQCPNYYTLEHLYNTIKAFNPKFRGFTVQTTCHQVCKWALDNISLKNLHIVNVELGIESFNDRSLKKYSKPQHTETITNAIWLLKWQFDVNIIPNIIIGLPGETIHSYFNTWNWIKRNAHKFLMLNVTNFVPYVGSDAANIVETQPTDLNQTTCKRSYHTKEEAKATKLFTCSLFSVGMDIIKATKERSK